jgi:L,D-transpeptidase YnhG
MGRTRICWFLAGCLLLTSFTALAAGKRRTPAITSAGSPVSLDRVADGVAEARLIEIYKLVGLSRNREALLKAEQLVRTVPNFQLAQLVYGDLLTARTRPLRVFGDVPEVSARSAGVVLNELREESLQRINALRERPPAGTIPSQFLALSTNTRHAIAVDASKSRLYLFQNSAAGLKLVADYYISVGKAGTSKAVEGDQRTPLGVYYITSNLDPKSLKDFYGSGALPISYPNVLDNKRGKTGGGIWLHGTPPNQFSRPPLATDGCVVLANPDLQHIIKTVEVRTTPVVIAPKLNWVALHKIQSDGKPFEVALQAWRNAKVSGDVQKILSFYAADFNVNGKTLSQWTPTLMAEIRVTKGRAIQLKDLSYLHWTDAIETMVVTFGEVADGARTGMTKRQYWSREGNQCKIFFEGLI